MEEEQKQNSSPDKALQDELDKTEQLGVEFVNTGRKITATGQKMIDFARATRQVSKFLSSDTAKENLIADFNGLNRVSDDALKQLPKINTAFSLARSAIGTAYVSSTGTVQQFSQSQHLPTEDDLKATDAIANLFNIVSLPASRVEVLATLQELRLDTAPKGTKKPSEQITIAFNAYEQPVSDTNPVATSLIPMRECIERIVAELLPRRHLQEEAKNAYSKIISIGMQLRRTGIDETTVHTWAGQYKEIIDELSDAKQKDISREEWTRRLQRAFAFLEGFLKGLDPAKFKK